MATPSLESFLHQSANYVRQTLPGLPAYSKVSRKQIEQQLVQCLEKYRGLAIRLDNYAPDGSTFEPRNMALLALEGTIPMSYRDKPYNIPVSIRLPQGFPVSPPQCYVVQTNGLVLKPQHTVVGPTGLCNFSRFEKGRWDPKHSSLRDLIDLMARVFGMEPPLYSPKSAAQQALNAAPPPAAALPAAATFSRLPSRKDSWEPKEPTSEELALPLETVDKLLVRLEVDEADNEDAADEAFQSLRDERIKLDDFLKTVRRLAREQYLSRALAKKATRLKPLLEERSRAAAAEQAEKDAAKAAEIAEREQAEQTARLAEEQAKRLRVQHEEERQRWEEQERQRQEEGRHRAEGERQRQEVERQHREQEQRYREEEQRRHQEQAAQEAREQAERERVWREEQERLQQEARRVEEDDRRVAERLEREERDRLQALELQKMQAATPAGGTTAWQNGPALYFPPPPSAAPQVNGPTPAYAYPSSSPGPSSTSEPVPAFPYSRPPPALPPYIPGAQYNSQPIGAPGPGPPFFPGVPYAQPPLMNQGPFPLSPPLYFHGQPPMPGMQLLPGGMQGPPGFWPYYPPPGYM